MKNTGNMKSLTPSLSVHTDDDGFMQVNYSSLVIKIWQGELVDLNGAVNVRVEFTYRDGRIASILVIDTRINCVVNFDYKRSRRYGTTRVLYDIEHQTPFGPSFLEGPFGRMVAAEKSVADIVSGYEA